MVTLIYTEVIDDQYYIIRDGQPDAEPLPRQEAMQAVASARNAAPGGPVHCGKEMAMRRGRYVCVVCGAEY